MQTWRRLRIITKDAVGHEIPSMENETRLRPYTLAVLNHTLPKQALLTRIWRDPACQTRVLADGAANRMWPIFRQSMRGDSPLAPPDSIGGDLDSIHPTVAAGFENAFGEGIFTHLPDQSLHDFEKCLVHCISEFGNGLSDFSETLRDLVVLGALGGDLGQEFANLNAVLRYTKHFHRVWLVDNEQVVVPLGVGDYTLSDSNSGMECSILPLVPTVVSTSGLQWDLSKDLLAWGGLVSSSNKFQDKCNDVDLSVHDGTCLFVSQNKVKTKLR